MTLQPHKFRFHDRASAAALVAAAGRRGAWGSVTGTGNAFTANIIGEFLVIVAAMEDVAGAALVLRAAPTDEREVMALCITARILGCMVLADVVDGMLTAWMWGPPTPLANIKSLALGRAPGAVGDA